MIKRIPRSERDSLINVLSRLKYDMDYVEKVAREDFGMIRKKERVYPLPKSSEDELPRSILKTRGIVIRIGGWGKLADSLLCILKILVS